MRTSLDGQIPIAAAWLGYGGLIPFVALALATWVPGVAVFDPGRALFLYGGVILSFVGALHWAFAMNVPDLTSGERGGAFAWSVVPALIAWVAMLLSPPINGVMLIIGFLVHYWRDRSMFRRPSIPAWYLPLRLRLTVVASLSLALGTVVAYK